MKIDDGEVRHPVEIQTTSTTSISRLVQTVLGKDLSIVALSEVQAKSSDGTTVAVDVQVKDLLQSGCGTTKESALLLILPEEEEPSRKKGRPVTDFGTTTQNPPLLQYHDDSRVPAGEAFGRKVWNMLTTATIQDKGNADDDPTKILHFSTVVDGLVDGPDMLVGDCYEVLYSRYIASTRHTVVTGNPGIGKTYFSYYVITTLQHVCSLK